MVEIKLKNKQTGYDIVGEYIERYWKHNIIDQVVVSLGLSRDGLVYEHYNEVASPCNSDIMFERDWWEGEEYIRIFGIISIDGLNITGGIYEE